MITRQAEYNIGVFGAGQIGLAIREMLQVITATKEYFTTLNIRTYDAVATDAGIIELDIMNDDVGLSEAVETNEIIISALPYDVTRRLAREVSAQGDRIYLDLTEDVGEAEILVQKNQDVKSSSIMVPHCGLAPGAISILAANLMKQFDVVHNVRMKVGALPVVATNKLKYNLAWSTSGLVNEYCNPCPIVKNGFLTTVPALEDYNIVSIDGIEYEAFNTSGGLGTFGSKCLDIVNVSPHVNISYQTLRYPGHRDLMKFLLSDMQFEKDKKGFVTLLDKVLPKNNNDKVVIMVEVDGKIGDSFAVRSYENCIYATETFTAIQLTTAGSLVSVVSWILAELELNNLQSFVTKGLLRNEDIPLYELRGASPFWEY